MHLDLASSNNALHIEPIRVRDGHQVICPKYVLCLLPPPNTLINSGLSNITFYLSRLSNMLSIIGNHNHRIEIES